MFLYKPYNITSEYEWLKTPEPIFIQEEVNNLKKTLRILQAPVKTVPFYSPPYYKTLWSYSEQDKQY